MSAIKPDLRVCTDHAKCVGGIYRGNKYVFLYGDGSENDGILYKDCMVPSFWTFSTNWKDETFIVEIDGRMPYWYTDKQIMQPMFNKDGTKTTRELKIEKDFRKNN